MIHILRTIDSFSAEVRATEKHLGQIEEEVQQLRSEAKKLRNRARRLENEVCQCTKERDSLAQELEKAQDLHRFKIQQLVQAASHLTNDPPSGKKQGRERKGGKCSFGAQC